jgi:hypothetical protein
MRKVTVKNFSVIKEAELEFGKITVLIGPQSSGKSLLCKLAYFLTKQTIEEALVAIVSRSPSDQSPFFEFKRELGREFIAWFPFETWYHNDVSITFESLAYRVEVSATKELHEVKFSFSPEFEALFGKLNDIVQRTLSTGPDTRRHITDQVRAQFSLLLNGTFIDRPLYIPDGRAFFANQSLGFKLVNNSDIDPILKEFSLEVSWGISQSPDAILGEEGARVLHEISGEILSIAGGQVEGRNGSTRFRRTSDDRSLPLPLLSSGTQAMLPMFNVLWQMITEQRGRALFPRPDNLPGMPNDIIPSYGHVYIEEPEANIFPSTQYELVRLFARLSHEPNLDFSWVITTHSPYILTAFNDLIKAGQIAAEMPTKASEVEKVIPRQYWIKPGDFAAYAFDGKEGILRSIMDEETKMINGDILDDISETISGEFGELLEIQYGA